MSSALLTATGDDQGLLTNNPNFNLTGLFHMYIYGNTYKFDYGDCGPNKYTASANPMLFYGDYYNGPPPAIPSNARPRSDDSLQSRCTRSTSVTGPTRQTR